jgi:hypothetical protein
MGIQIRVILGKGAVWSPTALGSIGFRLGFFDIV